MDKKLLSVVAVVVVVVLGFLIFRDRSGSNELSGTESDSTSQNQEAGMDENSEPKDPFTMEGLRTLEFPGSEFTIEQELGDKGKFKSYIVSYQSEGLKLRALMNVPDSPKPANGYRVVILNHGFIPPTTYSTINSYKAFADFYSNNEFLLFKPDYRSHDDSEGAESSAHTSNDYVVDVLNLISSIKKYQDADPSNIALWGHSNGGGISLKSLVLNKEIKSALLVAGVVASPQGLMKYWDEFKNTQASDWIRRTGQTFLDEHGTPESNPEFYRSISAYEYLDEIKVPVAIYHGTNDASVPLVFSEELNLALKALNKEVELHVYQGGDHNLAGNARSPFLRDSLEFLNRTLK